MKDILEHWHKAWPSEPEITATQLLKRTQGKARNDKTIDALRSALESAIPAISARKLGRFLRKHENAEHGPLMLSSRFDPHHKNYKFSVIDVQAANTRMREVAQQGAENLKARFDKERHPKRKLKEAERIGELIDAPSERSFDELYPPEARAQAALENEAARRARVERDAPKPETVIYVVPPGSRCWSYERTAEDGARALRGYGLNAQTHYVSGREGMRIAVRGVSLDEARRACQSIKRLEHCDVLEETVNPLKPEPVADYLSSSERLAVSRAMSWSGAPAEHKPVDRSWSVFGSQPDPRAEVLERMRSNDVCSDWRDSPNVPRKPRPDNE